MAYDPLINIQFRAHFTPGARGQYDIDERYAWFPITMEEMVTFINGPAIGCYVMRRRAGDLPEQIEVRGLVYDEMSRQILLKCHHREFGRTPPGYRARIIDRAQSEVYLRLPDCEGVEQFMLIEQCTRPWRDARVEIPRIVAERPPLKAITTTIEKTQRDPIPGTCEGGFLTDDEPAAESWRDRPPLL